MAKHLHRDLAELSKDILTLGARVEESLDWAVRALLERREDLAAKVRAADVVIDRQEVEVEENCLKILALHQPVAADLRFVITALKVNNDLERMGDHAVSIAGRAAKLSQKQPLESAEDINRLAMKVRAMVKLSLGALIERDVQADALRDFSRAAFAPFYREKRILEAAEAIQAGYPEYAITRLMGWSTRPDLRPPRDQ